MRLLVLVCILFASPLYGQNAKEIVKHYLDTVSNGDIKNWNKIKSSYVETESYYSQQDFDQKIDLLKSDKSNFLKSYWVSPDYRKNEIYEDSSFTKLLSTFYFLKDKTIILMGNVPPMIKQPMPQDEFFSEHLPVQISKILDKSRTVELLGIKEFPMEGVSCYEIKIITKGRKYMLYINTETFLLEYWNGREDEDISMLACYDNYKKQDGLLIPMSDSLMRNGNVYFWNIVRKYIINADIDLEIFNYKEN